MNKTTETQNRPHDGASDSHGKQQHLRDETEKLQLDRDYLGEEAEEEEEEEEEEEDMLLSEDNENGDNQEDELEQPIPHPGRAEDAVDKGEQNPRKPSLKIKLKFTGVSGSEHSSTPGEETPSQSGRKKSKGGSPESDYDSESEESSSVAPPARMTQRQAARAGMLDNNELLVWEEPESKKKKHLTEVELALRREETARKRKNLTEKKLEDEKTETINRLLKRQSRPRGKKARVADPEEDGEENEDFASADATPAPPPVPTMFRWISTSKEDSPALSFSVPPSLLPIENASLNTSVLPPVPQQTPLCDFSGCGQPRKYKLVKDPSRGGCGMEHLKALQTTLA